MTSNNAAITVNDPPTLSFDVHGRSNTSISYDTSAVLTWSTTNATSCQATGDWSGSKDTGYNRSFTFRNLTSNKTYTLTCTGAGGSITKSVSVNVANPIAPTVAFSASAGAVTNGQSVTLSWSISNATSTCTATNFTP